MNMKPREHWGSRFGFWCATAGSAIGLGSLWKFPYVTGENGGGLFVLAYLFFTFLIGIPIFVAELMLGRKSSLSPVGALGELVPTKPGWRFLGWSCALSSFLILSYYTVVSGWALNYALMSLLDFSNGKSSEEIASTFTTLYHSGDINLFWNFLFLGITTAIVYRGIRKGIEFWSKILLPLLFLILVALFIYATTLDGFGEAFSFIFKPDLSKLSPGGLLQALGLACFTLSVGMGILITYGSYMKKDEDIPKTAVTVACMEIFVSLLASMMIFPIIFTFGLSPEEGPGLLFKTLPVLFAKLPATLLLSTTFFLLVVFAALTSTISVMEVLVATVTENFGWPRHKSALIMGALVFIMGIPSALSGSGGIFKNWETLFGKTFFDTVDDFSFSWLLPINAFFIAIYSGWILDKALKKEEFSLGTNWKRLFKVWNFLVRWIVPIGVLIIVLEKGGMVKL